MFCKKMNRKLLLRPIFILWLLAITALSVMPNADNGVMEKSNLTPSGMEKHLIGYFFAALFCYFAYGSKNSEYNIKVSKYKTQQQTIYGNEIFFILVSGLLIFIYSIALEIIQHFLPYRTFNVYDIIANGSGICLFAVAYLLNYIRKKYSK